MNVMDLGLKKSICQRERERGKTLCLFVCLFVFFAKGSLFLIDASICLCIVRTAGEGTLEKHRQKLPQTQLSVSLRSEPSRLCDNTVLCLSG